MNPPDLIIEFTGPLGTPHMPVEAMRGLRKMVRDWLGKGTIGKLSQFGNAIRRPGDEPPN